SVERRVNDMSFLPGTRLDGGPALAGALGAKDTGVQRCQSHSHQRGNARHSRHCERSEAIQEDWVERLTRPSWIASSLRSSQ
ncbi:hypothetical protein, partial [Bosea thiooxidans]